MFEGLDDDNGRTHMVADCASGVAYTDSNFLVTKDSNVAQVFALKR